MKRRAKERPRKSEPADLALRALRRAARKVRAENRRLGIPLVVYKNGKTIAVDA